MTPRPTAAWVGLCLGCALLLTACADGDDVGAPAAQPANSSPAPGVPSEAAGARPGAESDGDSDVLLAVVRNDGSLELHRVGPGEREASLLRRLDAPEDGAEAVDVSMSDGDAPTVCASWHVGPGELRDGPQTTLYCYPWDSKQGREVEGVEQPAEVAVSADASRVAWSLLSQGEQNPVFSVAALNDGKVSSVRRLRGRSDQPEDAFTGTDVEDLAFTDDERLLVSTAVQSDDGPGLFDVDLDAVPEGGWLDAGVVPVPDSDPRYTVLDGVTSAGGGQALAIHRGSFQDEDSPPSRAVLLDVAHGLVREVVATAAEGRYVIGVSGSAAAAVYVTAAEDQSDVRAHLRLAGESKGVRMTGLPADIAQVLAQG